MKKNSIILTLCIFSIQGLFSAHVSATEKELKTRCYDREKTFQLERFVGSLYDKATYKKKRPLIKRLIEERADPNSTSTANVSWTLYSAIRHDDAEITECCLRHGASLYPCGNRSPLFWTESAAVAQCLIRYKQNVHQVEYNSNLLDYAISFNKSCELIAFFSNAGVDPNRQGTGGYTPLHDLCTMRDRSYDTTKKIAILLWAGASLQSTTDRGETPLDILQQYSPEMVPQMQKLMHIIPKIKAQQKKTYKIMMKRLPIPDECADAIMSYIGTSPWSDNCWARINTHLKTKACSSCLIS